MGAAQEAVRTVKLLHKIFLVTIALYAYVGEMVPHMAAAPENLKLYRIVFFVVATGNIVIAMVLRQKLVESPEERLMRNAADNDSLARWRGGSLVTFVLCETVALLGLVLRFLGAPLRDAAAFYVIAAAMLLIWAPRAEFARQS